MSGRWRRILALLSAISAALCLEAQAPRLQIWCRSATGILTRHDGGDTPIPVGSLQKPFVVAAWAAAHPGQAPPRFHCGPESGCWLPVGHGDLSLPHALAVSCNTYFRNLAESAPPAQLGRAFRDAGFLRAPRSPEEAIGLSGPDGPLRICPSALLTAYDRLVRQPWIEGESLRGQVLAGLREAALEGTAKGLGHRGFWAKTGTVPATDGNPLRTCGLAVAVDDVGWAILARLEPGTGRAAAATLDGAVSHLRPGAPALYRPSPARGPLPIDIVEARSVRVRLFDLLPAGVWEVLNLGNAPIPAGAGFLGPGGIRVLHPGDQIGTGHLELRQPSTGLRRRFLGSLDCTAGYRGALRLVATLDLRDYVSGVVAAEAPGRSQSLREQLGATVIRFLARGPRHVDAEACDQTHCAWFTGEGPRLHWVDPRHAATLLESSEAVTWGYADAAWMRVLETAHQPGPAFWTAHCGGEPLSPHAIWEQGDMTVTPCPRHGPSEAALWHRTWSAEALAKVFGGRVEDLEIRWTNGSWRLIVRTSRSNRTLSYDEAHRMLATVLGWDALPSPADKLTCVSSGYEAIGRGSGHRVGLCLGD